MITITQSSICSEISTKGDNNDIDLGYYRPALSEQGQKYVRKILCESYNKVTTCSLDALKRKTHT